MRDLQPVAFLISMSLVIAAFYEKNGSVDTVNLKYVLLAALYFFFAYIGLFLFMKSDFLLSLYYGEFSLIVAAIYLFKSFTGIVQIVFNAFIGNGTIGNAIIGN